nr:PREDICTED: serine/threonine-protein kinase LMTK3-like [Struthio camelus australis]
MEGHRDREQRRWTDRMEEHGDKTGRRGHGLEGTRGDTAGDRGQPGQGFPPGDAVPQEDYYVTPDRLWIPLRWVAPELLEETRGTLSVVDQSKESNVWSLGVTLWELFEFGSQPYRHLSDEEVLAYVVREQQMTLAKPRLKLPHSDYW